MQFFSIGMYELNPDGTRKLDENSRFISSYSNDDIMEYARVWTGFRQAKPRGNIENALYNNIDPMEIHVPWRDVFPKLGLGQKYIGDGYPLCVDRPKHHFLKKGAKYILLGHNPLPELQKDTESWAVDPWAIRFVANPAGALNHMLCDATGDINAPCGYPSIVTLKENLDCEGHECNVDTLRVVEVTGGVFYEYVPLPCVSEAFYENPQKVKKRSGPKGTASMCADPRLPVASTSCCSSYSSETHVEDTFWGERVKFATAEQRCYASGSIMCRSTGEFTISDCQRPSCDGDMFYWMSKDEACHLKAKIDRKGKVALVHSVEREQTSTKEKRQEEEDNKTFFRVQFFTDENVTVGLDEQLESSPECSISNDGFWICDVVITNEQAYSSLPTQDQVLSSLTIGSFPPETLDGPFTVVEEGGVKAHLKDEQYSQESVFEVVDRFGAMHLRKNVRSTVRIEGTHVKFRNPVHFMSLTEPTLRDAQYETDAAIDHLFYNQNTAPFLAVRLARRFGSSNPSPGYVQRIVKAFQTGTYVFTDGIVSLSFGKGQYGDLEATLAAILLDIEARDIVLDADPAHGWLKEPILKVTGLMRNLEFQETVEYPFPRFRKNLQNTIGQMVYDAPSVFSFFHPEFQPNDLIASAGMVSPEAQVHSSPQVVGTMNGLLSMIKYGLDRCFGGLGYSRNWKGSNECQWRVPGDYENSSSYPEFVPKDASSVDGIVSELAMVMTSGRLSEEHVEMIMDVVETEEDPMSSILKAEQLIAATSEFHSTGTISKAEGIRNQEKRVTSTKRPYKAFVMVLLNGGLDSYNLVVPHKCEGTNQDGLTVLEQYTQQRGHIGLQPHERNLLIHAEGQPCETFAIHDRIPIVKELYEQGDLSFFLNAGVVNAPSTNETFEDVTVSQLFAHDTMQNELQRIDPFDQVISTGILRRISQRLNNSTYGYQSQTISLNFLNPSVYGNDEHSPRSLVVSQDGPQKFNERPKTEHFDPLDQIKSLNGPNYITSNMFGDFWSDAFMRALDENDFLEDLLDKVTLDDSSCGSKALNMVVKMMETRRGRGNDRDLFYVNMDAWDHHSNVKEQLSYKLRELNEALECFMKNAKGKGLWDHVTLLVVSEFGRTMTPNTNNGSDRT